MRMMNEDDEQQMINYIIIIIHRSMESIVDQQKIHFYEFMQIEILQDYIQSGIEYMVKSLLGSSNRLINLRYYSSQIASLICAVKNAYFLIKHKALYVQNFYGFERVNKRSKKQIIIELIVWVLLPYLFKKMQQKYLDLRERQQAGQQLGTLGKIWSKIFPVIYCLCKVACAIFKFRYLLVPESQHYNIDYFVTKTQLGYIEETQKSPYPIMSFLKSPGLFILLIAHKAASAIFANQIKTKNNQSQIKIAQPPLNERKQKICPICGKAFKNPAVLLSSGYVFCYSCILGQIKSTPKCPVTQIPCTETQIQIIYS